MLSEAISITREGVSSDIQTIVTISKYKRITVQTLRSGFKRTRFFNSLLSVWISDETPILVK